MIEPETLREQCAARLLTLVEQASRLRTFVGLDGFVDEIIHVVDKRENPESYSRLTTIPKLAERIGAAAGKSTNIELMLQRTKLGGNGPIMANALAGLGLRVTYVGALGYPTMHPVFNELAERAEVYSIFEPGRTAALEFEDGKVMLTRSAHFTEITWPKIQERFSRDKFLEKFSASELVAFVNWTMIPYMSDLWEDLLQECAPKSSGTRRVIFFDLADPEKRTQKDILRALKLISRFEQHFDVILGLNEKEAGEVGKALGLHTHNHSREGLSNLAKEIQKQVPVGTLVVHPVSYALAVSKGEVSLVDGPFTEKPLITTGAGDHFNAGFCLGKLLGFANAESVLLGVSTSGFYVRQGQSPKITDLVDLLRRWPGSDAKAK